MPAIKFRKRRRDYLVTGSIGTAKIRIALSDRQEALWAVKLFRAVAAEGKAERVARGQQGGAARASKLSPERRQEIARKAVAARWAKVHAHALPDAEVQS